MNIDENGEGTSIDALPAYTLTYEYELTVPSDYEYPNKSTNIWVTLAPESSGISASGHGPRSVQDIMNSYLDFKNTAVPRATQEFRDAVKLRIRAVVSVVSEWEEYTGQDK